MGLISSCDEGQKHKHDSTLTQKPPFTFEIIVPLFLIAGYKTRIVASLLALFVLTVTAVFHAHHIFTDSMQLTVFLKNISILGGLLIIIANKPQICSFDYFLENKKK